MRVNCLTDTGAVRSTNQDSCDSGLFSQDSAWAIVCDGMGGANGGNVASSLATETIREEILNTFHQDLSRENIKTLMLNAVRKANRKVHEFSQEKPELSGMGTTAVLMIATKGTLHVVHVGDSRAYLWNGADVEQITMDHSYVQDLVNFGQITPEQARTHPQRNIITRVIGVHMEVECDYNQCDFHPGSLALACSDGLSGYVDEAILTDYIEKQGHQPEALAQKLIAYANECGGADNITAAIIRNER